jgi:acetoin utilization protein AcuB
MQHETIRHLPVVRAGTLLGILSDRDLLLRAERTAQGDVIFPKLSAVDAMTPSPITCAPNTEVSEVARTLIDRKIDALPVVSAGKLLGLVTSTDLLALLVEQKDSRVLPFDFRLHEVA